MARIKMDCNMEAPVKRPVGKLAIGGVFKYSLDGKAFMLIDIGPKFGAYRAAALTTGLLTAISLDEMVYHAAEANLKVVM